MNTTTSSAYNYKVVRQFAIMTVVWGIVGMGLGVFLAAQLVWPELNFDLPWTSFGRLRPLHTNAVIFAFGGCALFALTPADAAGAPDTTSASLSRRASSKEPLWSASA